MYNVYGQTRSGRLITDGFHRLVLRLEGEIHGPKLTVIKQTIAANEPTTYSTTQRSHHFLGRPINDHVANLVVAQLLFLQAQDATKTFHCI